MVAVDGSPAAHLAFEVVSESFLHPTDRLTVAHIYSDQKTYLPFDMQPQNLKKTYETLTLPLGSRVNLWWDEADPKVSTKEQMLLMA
jgi:hypothetical protein